MEYLNSMEKPGDTLKCYLVSWDEAYQLARSLARKIRRSGFKPDLVIGIARGGLVPARIVCDFLLQKDLASVKVEHWGMASTLGKAKIKYPLPAEAEVRGKKILVIDDVADTGDTYAVIADYLKEKGPAQLRTAALHYKTCSTFVPDYWCEKQDTWKWIIYPWALYEDLTEFIEKVLVHPMTHNDIRKRLKGDFDIKLPEKELLEILNDMHLAGKLKRKRKGRAVFWESIKNKQ
jgi:hypoxanthine phosphoribosyltransferase